MIEVLAGRVHHREDGEDEDASVFSVLSVVNSDHRCEAARATVVKTILKAHCRWRAAESALECVNEVAEAAETTVEANIGDAGAIEKHAPRRLESHLQQVLMWRTSGELSENPRELEGADGDRRSHRGKRVRLCISLLER